MAAAPGRAVMSNKLMREQDLLKAMLPATTPHHSIKSWTTKQMVCIRFVDKIGTGNKKFKRVMCITPTTLFLCHIVGEVRRFVKMSQVEGAIKSDVGGIPQLLIRCSSPEHDVLVNFISDSRNDAKEKPGVFIDKLTKIKELRGEFFNVEHRVGSLFKIARLKKVPEYVAPKARMDKAQWFIKNKNEPQEEFEEDYDENGYSPVEAMGMQAGSMGEYGTRPAPPPPSQSMYRPVVVDDSPSFASAAPMQSNNFTSQRAPPQQQSYPQPVKASPSFSSPQQSYGHATPLAPSFMSSPPQQQFTSVNKQPLYSNEGPPAGFNPVHNQPTVFKKRFLGGPSPSFGKNITSAPQSYNGFVRPPSSVASSGNSRGGGIVPQTAFSNFNAPQPHTTTVETYKPPRQTETEKWDQRRISVDAVGAPRPEDLGAISALRSKDSPFGIKRTQQQQQQQQQDDPLKTQQDPFQYDDL